MESCFDDWESLSEEYKSLEAVHKSYIDQLDTLSSSQLKIEKEIKHQRYKLKQIQGSLNKIRGTSEQEKELKSNLETDIIRRKAQLHSIEGVLPKKNDLYLNIILGSVNVSILNKDQRFKYKEEYEKFKLVITIIGLVLSVVNLFSNNRVLDLLFMFLLVWYYCTLTIRESILKVNGSRIKGWWRAHHFLSTITSGILLIWPNGTCYYAFRTQFVIFNVYISLVQYLQWVYQRGCLYRLKSLGMRQSCMDITIEGFHSWMWRGLSFLLPFLFGGYAFQFYNALTLWNLSSHPEAEWQVLALSISFFFIFAGNFLTTMMIIPEKIKKEVNFKYRFTRLDKYFWTHKKSSFSMSRENLHDPKNKEMREFLQKVQEEAEKGKVEEQSNGENNSVDSFELVSHQKVESDEEKKEK